MWFCQSMNYIEGIVSWSKYSGPLKGSAVEPSRVSFRNTFDFQMLSKVFWTNVVQANVVAGKAHTAVSISPISTETATVSVFFINTFSGFSQCAAHNGFSKFTSHLVLLCSGFSFQAHSEFLISAIQKIFAAKCVNTIRTCSWISLFLSHPILL